MKSIRWRAIAVLILTALPTSGCAALSLFSTTHEHHYEPSPEVERRLSALEQRFNSFEQTHTASSSAVISGNTARSDEGIQQSGFAAGTGSGIAAGRTVAADKGN